MPETFSAREAPRKGSKKETRLSADLPDLELDPLGGLTFEGKTNEGPELSFDAEEDVSLDEPIELDTNDIEDVTTPSTPLTTKQKNTPPPIPAKALQRFRRKNEMEDRKNTQRLLTTMYAADVPGFIVDPKRRQKRADELEKKRDTIEASIKQLGGEVDSDEKVSLEEIQKQIEGRVRQHKSTEDLEREYRLALLKQSRQTIVEEERRVILHPGEEARLRRNEVEDRLSHHKDRMSQEYQGLGKQRLALEKLVELYEPDLQAQLQPTSERARQYEQSRSRTEKLGQPTDRTPLVPKEEKRQNKIQEEQKRIKTRSRAIEDLQSEYTQRYGGDIVRAANGEEGALEGIKRIGIQIGGFLKSIFKKREKEDSRTEMILKYKQALDALAVAEDALATLTADAPESLRSLRVPSGSGSTSREHGWKGGSFFEDWGGKESTRRELQRREEEEEGWKNAERTQARASRSAAGRPSVEDLEVAFEGQEQRTDDEYANMRAWRTMLLAGRTPDNQPLNAKTLKDIHDATIRTFNDQKERKIPSSEETFMLNAVVDLNLKELRTKLPKHAQETVENWQKVTAKKVSSLSTALNRPATSQEHIKTQRILDKFMEIFEEDTPEAAITSYKLSMEALANLSHHRSISEKMREQIGDDYFKRLDSAHEALGMSKADRANFSHDMERIAAEVAASAAESSGRTSTRKAA